MRHSRLVLAGRTLKDVREAAARVSKAFDSSRDAAGPLRPLALVALLRMVYEYPVVTTVFDKQTRRLTARCENLDDLPGGGEGPRDFSMTGVATMIGALGGGDEVKEVVIEASGATDALVVLSDTDLLQEASSGESVEELLTQEAEAGGLVQLVRMLSRLTDFHGLNQAFSGLKSNPTVFTLVDTNVPAAASLPPGHHQAAFSSPDSSELRLLASPLIRSAWLRSLAASHPSGEWREVPTQLGTVFSDFVAQKTPSITGISIDSMPDDFAEKLHFEAAQYDMRSHRRWLVDFQKPERSGAGKAGKKKASEQHEHEELTAAKV